MKSQIFAERSGRLAQYGMIILVMGGDSGAAGQAAPVDPAFPGLNGQYEGSMWGGRHR
jgi:hypothetical protein